MLWEAERVDEHAIAADLSNILITEAEIQQRLSEIDPSRPRPIR